MHTDYLMVRDPRSNVSKEAKWTIWGSYGKLILWLKMFHFSTQNPNTGINLEDKSGKNLASVQFKIQWSTISKTLKINSGLRKRSHTTELFQVDRSLACSLLRKGQTDCPPFQRDSVASIPNFRWHTNASAPQ